VRASVPAPLSTSRHRRRCQRRHVPLPLQQLGCAGRPATFRDEDGYVCARRRSAREHPSPCRRRTLNVRCGRHVTVSCHGQAGGSPGRIGQGDQVGPGRDRVAEQSGDFCGINAYGVERLDGQRDFLEPVLAAVRIVELRTGAAAFRP